MKKILALLLTLVFTVLACAACGSQNDQPEEAVQTEIRLDACGLAYTIPTSWTGTDNINIIPTSYAQPESSIYALVRYDYAPDENMAELNDMESETAVEDRTAGRIVGRARRTGNGRCGRSRNGEVYLL